MSLVINRTQPAKQIGTEPENSRDIYDQLLPFDFLEYQSGTKIAQLKDLQTEELNILAKGRIKVKVLCSIGETILHEFLPGDVLRLGDISRIAATEMGAPSNIRTVLQLEGNTRVIRLRQFEIERMFICEAKLKFKLFQEMIQKWHEALQNMEKQCCEIRNYIYH